MNDCLLIKDFSKNDMLEDIMKKENLLVSKVNILLLQFLVLSPIAISAIIFIVAEAKYRIIAVLPLVYSAVNILARDIFKKDTSNIAKILITLSLYVRFVVSPLLLVLSDIHVTYQYFDFEFHLVHSIFLCSYEILWIYTAMMIYYNKIPRKHSRIRIKETHIESENIVQKVQIPQFWLFFVFILGLIFIISVLLYPQLIKLNRWVWQVFVKESTHFTSDSILNPIMKSVFGKLVAVVFNYIMHALKFIIPLSALVIIKNYSVKHSVKKSRSIFLSLCVIFISLLRMDETIARMLVFSVVFVLLVLKMYDLLSTKNIYVLIALAAFLVLLYIVARITANSIKSFSIAKYLSNWTNTYFASFVTVTGSLNLPFEDKSLRIKYFFYDYLKSIPFGNTIFGLNSPEIGVFFNKQNMVYGQIPTTIGMGSFYFGDLLAPIYSYVFASLALKSYKRAMESKDYIYSGILMLASIYFCLGISMYNIHITFQIIFILVVPMYVVNIIAIKARDNGKEIKFKKMFRRKNDK